MKLNFVCLCACYVVSQKGPELHLKAMLHESETQPQYIVHKPNPSLFEPWTPC